jgi:hypothetical protein
MTKHLLVDVLAPEARGAYRQKSPSIGVMELRAEYRAYGLTKQVIR